MPGSRFVTLGHRGLSQFLVHSAWRVPNEPPFHRKLGRATIGFPVASLVSQLRSVLIPVREVGSCSRTKREKAFAAVSRQESVKSPSLRGVSTMHANAPKDGNVAAAAAIQEDVVYVFGDRTRASELHSPLPSQPGVVWREERDSPLESPDDDKLKFRVDRFWPHLRCNRLAGMILVSNRIPSTQSLLSK